MWSVVYIYLISMFRSGNGVLEWDSLPDPAKKQRKEGGATSPGFGTDSVTLHRANGNR